MTDAERLRGERNILLDEIESLENRVMDPGLTKAGIQAALQSILKQRHEFARKCFESSGAPSELERVHREADALVRRAERSGLVLTVTQQSLQPFAMGHYQNVVSVRHGRGSYR